MTTETHTIPTDDRRDQTGKHDVARHLQRGTGDKRGESADSIRPHLQRGRRGPPSEGRQS